MADSTSPVRLRRSPMPYCESCNGGGVYVTTAGVTEEGGGGGGVGGLGGVHATTAGVTAASISSKNS